MMITGMTSEREKERVVERVVCEASILWCCILFYKMCATPKAGQKLPPLTTYIIVGHLRKLFKFQIYSWAPGWIELAPAYTFTILLSTICNLNWNWWFVNELLSINPRHTQVFWPTWKPSGVIIPHNIIANISQTTVIFICLSAGYMSRDTWWRTFCSSPWFSRFIIWNVKNREIWK